MTTISSSPITQPVGGLLQKNLAYVTGTAKVEYVGFSDPGTLDTEAGWLIQKLTYDGANVTQVRFASDDVTDNKIWDSRATYF